MKDYLSKILRFFVLNKLVKHKEKSTFFVTAAIYVCIWLGLGMVKLMTGWIPLIGNFTYNVEYLYGFYALAGIILAAVQCFRAEDYGEVEYLTFDSIKRAWESRNAKIAIIVAAVILCIIPHGKGLFSSDAQKEQSKAESMKEEVVEQDEISNDSVHEAEVQEEERASENEEEQEEAVSNSEDTIVFYEYAKGYWTGMDLKCVFDIVNNAYYMCIRDKEQQNIEYEVESLKVSDSEVNAILADKNTGKKYDVVLLEDTNGKKVKIKEQEEENWLLFSDNHNITSFEEMLILEECSVGYLNKREVWYMEIRTLEFAKENAKYMFLDVSSETPGEELILQTSLGTANTYYIFGEEDGIIKCLYEMDSYREMECCDAGTSIFWCFMDNGTSGESCYYRYDYLPGKDAYEEVSIGVWSDEPKPSGELPYFAPMGTDYEQAQQREAQGMADSNIMFDESNVITEPIESYEGVYVYEHLEIELSPSEDICSLTCYYEGETTTTSIMGLGSRVVAEEIPDGMVMYAVAGNVRQSGIRGNQTAACQILLVLKPDGNIYIENAPSDGSTTELFEGIYERKDAE